MTGAGRVSRGRLGVEAGIVALALVGVALAIRALPVRAGDRAAGWSLTAADLQLTGTLWPARLGLNRLEMTVADAAGRAAADVEVEAAFLPVGGGAVIVRRTLAPAADAGRYTAASFTLLRPGPWQMLVTVRRAGQPNAYASLDWVTGPDQSLRLAAEPLEDDAALRDWINQNGAAALSLLAAGGVLIWARRVWQALRPWWRRGG